MNPLPHRHRRRSPHSALGLRCVPPPHQCSRPFYTLHTLRMRCDRSAPEQRTHHQKEMALCGTWACCSFACALAFFGSRPLPLSLFLVKSPGESPPMTRARRFVSSTLRSRARSKASAALHSASVALFARCPSHQEKTPLGCVDGTAAIPNPKCHPRPGAFGATHLFSNPSRTWPDGYGFPGGILRGTTV